MATVNFSVPDEVREAFDRTFKEQNRSAIIADLMRQTVIESNRRKERQEIFRKLTRRRAERPALSDEQIRAARVAGRP